MMLQVRFTVALAGLALLPTAAWAQTDYEVQVRGYLQNSAETILASDGYRSTNDVYTGSLSDQSSDEMWVTLRGGQAYALLGVCDVDCDDVDLYLYDDSGNEVDSDVSSDDVPLVQVTPSRGSRYRVRIQMYNCETEPCYYAVGVYSRSNTINTPAGSDDYQGQADEYLEEAYRTLLGSGNHQIAQSFASSLDDSAEEFHRLHLERGRAYAILGACDDDCEDMDFYLVDRNGDEIVSDVETAANNLHDRHDLPAFDRPRGTAISFQLVSRLVNRRCRPEKQGPETYPTGE